MVFRNPFTFPFSVSHISYLYQFIAPRFKCYIKHAALKHDIKSMIQVTQTHTQSWIQLTNTMTTSSSNFWLTIIKLGCILPDPLPMVKARWITRECGCRGERDGRPESQSRAQPGQPGDAVTGPSCSAAWKQSSDVDHGSSLGAENNKYKLNLKISWESGKREM